MKRYILLTLLIGLFAVQANAAMYTMDATTAADMRLVRVSLGDSGDLRYVGMNPGILPAYYPLGDLVYDGGTTVYGALDMRYSVGFTGWVEDGSNPTTSNPANGLARVSLGLKSASGLGNLGITGTYNGFELSVANDDLDLWIYRAYVTKTDDGVPDGLANGLPTTLTMYSSFTSALSNGQTANLIVSTPVLDYSTDVTGIGFEIRWATANNSNSDFFNTSVVTPVPVPAAFLLGLLGIGAAGIKLRKFA